MCQICFFGNIRYFFIVGIQILLILNYRYINGPVLCESKAGFENTSFMDRDPKMFKICKWSDFLWQQNHLFVWIKKGTMDPDRWVWFKSWIRIIDPDISKNIAIVLLFLFLYRLFYWFLWIKNSPSLVWFFRNTKSVFFLFFNFFYFASNKAKMEKLCVMRVFEEQQN